MRETTGNLWDYLKVGAVLCITTNGLVRNGRNVMGRGCAKEARDQFKDIDYRIGARIKAFGNHSFRLPMPKEPEHQGTSLWTLVTIPTKHHWRDPSDPMLIAQSIDELVEMADGYAWSEVVLPRPGCGNGQLEWENVKELIEPMLDDRFIVVNKRTKYRTKKM